MSTLVTVAIPIYKRLTTLPQALQSVAAQKHENIELIVSDNGQNGNQVKEIIEQWYPRPYVSRQNPETVPISPHYNQLIEAASGEYCVVLDDDDTLSPDFVSELAGILDVHQEVAVALARQEVVDEAGNVLGRSADSLPPILPGEDFIRSWTKYGFACYTAMLGRTSLMRALGGYENFPRGTHSDDALLIKLCLSGAVAFSQHSIFRWRVNSASYGWSMDCQALAVDTKQFLTFINGHPTLKAYASRCPDRWEELRPLLMHLGWHTYYERWAGMYQERLSFFDWLKAGFAMPYIPDYYRAVQGTLLAEGRARVSSRIKQRCPWLLRAWHFMR